MSPKYPGPLPGRTTARLVGEERAILENAAIRCEWHLAAGLFKGVRVENRHTGQVLSLGPACLPRVLLADGTVADPASLPSAESVRLDGNALVAGFRDPLSGLAVKWSARLEDGANAVIQVLEVTATRDTKMREWVFLDAPLPGARRVGEVDGSVVVCGELFVAVEHPLAKNTVEGDSRARCVLPQRGVLKAGQSRTATFALGAVPPRQLRRGFLYYLERRRAHPYRPFLHYNNWYDVVLSRPTERATEAECLDTIEYYGRELVEKRGVHMDAFVWDDGWDDFHSLWDFHRGFPDGFRNLDAAARRHGAAQGVWMSPNGGYARAKEARLAHGRARGYETNANGFAMGGPNYRRAFREACLKMIREQGVVFFKFDGMGEGGSGKGTTDGTTGELSDDIHGMLELARELHRENPEVFISATCGTWASPFWLLYADSIWRQGGDSGHYGPGDTRQQWLTYRDRFVCERVVRSGPLYPLNSLMLHGVLIGNRPNRAPAGMVLDEKSVADEIWSFFGSGTCLQELYVSPGVPTATMLDHLAAAANWARANADVLVDTHWVGGDPGRGEVYGWASWQPGKGIVVLRNPSASPRAYRFKPADALELPAGEEGAMTLRAVYPRDRDLPGSATDVSTPFEIQLQPFEVVVMELR